MKTSLILAFCCLLLACPAGGQTSSHLTPAASPPAASTPLPQLRTRYTLRPGDVVTIDYRYTPEFNQVVAVQPDGFVELTLVGQTRVAGLTLAQLQAYMVERSSVRLKDPEINVALKDFEKPFFAVAGEVEHPGRFDFYVKTTALQAILLAGGAKGSGQIKDVYVFRRVDGQLAEVHHLDLRHMRRTSDLERDLVLEPGDMILVPRNKLENIGRFTKAINLGVYFDPLTYAFSK
jgi:polysaccharide export outer membrane protein